MIGAIYQEYVSSLSDRNKELRKENADLRDTITSLQGLVWPGSRREDTTLVSFSELNRLLEENKKLKSENEKLKYQKPVEKPKVFCRECMYNGCCMLQYNKNNDCGFYKPERRRTTC